MKNEKTVLELENVSKKYCSVEETCAVVALDNVSLKVNSGEFVAVVGPSGSGKSTLLHMMGILDDQTSGKIYLDGSDISKMNEDKKAEIRRNEIGFVFQMFNLIPSLTAIENVEIPQILIGIGKDERRRKAKEILKKLGMEKRENHFPNQLSGGEKQRIAIARALVNDPKIILADEPTGNLDSKRGSEILQVFQNLNKEGKTIVMITHDPNIAKNARRIVKIKDGKII
ncbi:MAG: ABC transporter ATP-binding protein [Candidatus ainarchaeum sp.]|nr:ABC transporter ATP-binding protein [Candidatus ainarchaeum sp.]